MSQVITLFCEGEKNGLDERVLHKLHPRKAEVRPIGGKTAFNSFINGYCSTPLVTSKDYIRVFRDRDFDYVPSQSPTLIVDKYFFISYRTTIENYLLHPRTIYEYVHASGKEKKIRDLLPSLSESEKIFKETCQELRFYTAARWAHGATKKSAGNRFSFNSDWPYDSGNLPTKFDEDTACRTILSSIIENIRTKATQLDFGEFEKQYAEFVVKFDHDFTNNLHSCLTWFNGKDIAARIHQKIGGNNFFGNGTKGDYYDFALGDEYFVKLLNEGEFPDLIQLQGILNGNTPIEPISIKS
ncbi:MAG: DUF4435 domain-containing protein [Saprospiraceae bacterium]|nr:DUF4435 domain-containing protein [Saprospiraceae bacterium]